MTVKLRCRDAKVVRQQCRFADAAFHKSSFRGSTRRGAQAVQSSKRGGPRAAIGSHWLQGVQTAVEVC